MLGDKAHAGDLKRACRCRHLMRMLIASTYRSKNQIIVCKASIIHAKLLQMALKIQIIVLQSIDNSYKNETNGFEQSK